MTDLATLNQRFGLNRQLHFKQHDQGQILAEIDNHHATATIALQGAQVVTWRPKTETVPVIWVSTAAQCVPGKSIRGGVPVCWPWFGAHATQSTFPAHGYARTTPWQVIETRALAGGETKLVLSLMENDQTRALWPHATPVSIDITIGQTLTLVLTTRNATALPVTLSEALHTYFHISDIEAISIRGLEGVEYLDKVENFARKRQQGPIRFNGETDRVYVNTAAACIIDDAQLQRRIHIAKAGSRSTVVWNPWQDKAEKMGDLGPQGWRSMVCVESANALDNALVLQPAEQHSLSVEYSVER